MTNHRTLTIHGKPLTLLGNQLAVGAKVPDFKATANDMSDLTPAQFQGKVVIYSTVPSLDTPTCSIETKRFNLEAEKIGQSVTVLTLSMDLPFAQKRWCGAEGVSNVITASDYKYRSVGEAFGVHIQELGLLARAVFVADTKGTLTYVEYVSEVSAEPDYAKVLEAVRALV